MATCCRAKSLQVSVIIMKLDSPSKGFLIGSLPGESPRADSVPGDRLVMPIEAGSKTTAGSLGWARGTATCVTPNDGEEPVFAEPEREAGEDDEEPPVVHVLAAAEPERGRGGCWRRLWRDGESRPLLTPRPPPFPPPVWEGQPSCVGAGAG